MAPPIESWTEADDTTAATPWHFVELAPNNPSPWQTKHLWNNRAGASPVDPFLNAKLRVLARIEGDTVWRAAEIVALETRSIEVEILGGSAGSGIEPRSPVRIGAGAWLDLPEIPNDEAIYLRARVFLPAVAGETALELDFAVDRVLAEALPSGLWESAGGGIRLGIGDGAVTQLLVGAVPAASGPADNVVTPPDLAWVHLGIPYAILTDGVTLNQNDGAAATLAAGEAYYALFSLGAGALTLTKGLKDTAPLDETNIPATPAGEKAYALVLVDTSATIDQADISLLTEPWAHALAFDGLNVILGPGESLVGGRWERSMTPSQVAVAASDTSEVFILPDGSLAATVDGSRPADRALLVAEATANATDVTALVDLRDFQDRLAVRAQFALPAPTVADVAYWVNGTLSPLYVRPVSPILFSLVNDPATLAATSGSWKVEIEKLTAGFAWVSLFTSSGSDDRRPSIPFDSTSGRDLSAFPEILEVLPGQVLRCRVVSIASGGTPASALVLSLILESPLG